jgi:hypothetical protein
MVLKDCIRVLCPIAGRVSEDDGGFLRNKLVAANRLCSLISP